MKDKNNEHVNCHCHDEISAFDVIKKESAVSEDDNFDDDEFENDDFDDDDDNDDED